MGKSLVFSLGLFSVFSVSEIQSMLVAREDINLLPGESVLEILAIFRERFQDKIPMLTRNGDCYQQLWNFINQYPGLSGYVYDRVQQEIEGAF